jgi:hypothetical protein
LKVLGTKHSLSCENVGPESILEVEEVVKTMVKVPGPLIDILE